MGELSRRKKPEARRKRPSHAAVVAEREKYYQKALVLAGVYPDRTTHVHFRVIRLALATKKVDWAKLRPSIDYLTSLAGELRKLDVLMLDYLKTRDEAGEKISPDEKRLVLKIAGDQKALLGALRQVHERRQREQMRELPGH